MTGKTFRYHLLAIVFICLCGILAYANTVDAPFVFDDRPNITENIGIRVTELDLDRLWNAGSRGPSPRRRVANASFALNYLVGGYDVTGYHVVNTSIHVVNGILVYLICLILFTQVSHTEREGTTWSSARVTWLALFSACLFVVHPLQTQSVTYIVQRMNSLSALFYLLAFLMYLRGRSVESHVTRGALWLGSLVSWLAALGSKEIAATLPVILLLYEWLFRDFRPTRFKRTVLLATIGALPMLVIAAFWPGFAGYATRDFTLWERVLTQFRVIASYGSLVVYPHPDRLNLIHGISSSRSLLEPVSTLACLLLVVGVLALGLRLTRRRPLVAFCIFWVAVNLVIESSVLPLEMMFEHRMYLPMFGVALAAGYGLSRVTGRARLWAGVLCVVTLLLLGMATYVRNGVWGNKMTFWSDVLSKNPNSHRAHVNLGRALNEQGRVDAAIVHYYESIRIKPDYAVAHMNLGNALKSQGRLSDALEHYRAAIRFKPAYPRAHYNMGNALAAMGKLREAVMQYQQVLRMEPRDALTHNNLGAVLARMGRRDEAIHHLSRAVGLKPGYGRAHHNLGNVLAGDGRFKEALEHLSQAARFDPDNAEAHYDLGKVLASQGLLDKAIEHMSRAIRIRPDYAEARVKLEEYALKSRQ